MKSQFIGAYREVARLLDAPAKPVKGAQKGPEFQGLLKEVSPDVKQIAEKTQQRAAQQAKEAAPQAPPRGPMASYRFSEPELMEPQAPPLVPEAKIDSSVTVQPESVKSPAILSARRVTVEQPFDSLPRDHREDIVADKVKQAGAVHGVDPLLAMSVVNAESSFRAEAVSNDGRYSKGLFQLLDSTGQEQLKLLNGEGDYTPFDVEQNIELGTQYLRRLHDFFSEPTALNNGLTTVAAANSAALEKLAVAAFNAGEGRVASAQDRAKRAGLDPAEYAAVEPYLPDTTQEYVQRVIAGKERFQPRFIG